MSVETFQWFAGALSIPTVMWALHQTWGMSQNRADVKELLSLNRNPILAEAIKENTTAVNQLTHYTIYAIKKQTGEDPPPPIG